MSTERDARPYIVVTAILDGSARAAAVTMSHGDAMERALSASADQAIAAWTEKNQGPVDRTDMLLSELAAGDINDLSMIAVASRQLRGLAAVSQG